MWPHKQQTETYFSFSVLDLFLTRSLMATGGGWGGDLLEAAGRPSQTTAMCVHHFPHDMKVTLQFWNAMVELSYLGKNSMVI